MLKNYVGGEYDFSYSGLKTAVINYVHNEESKGNKINKADVAASFQHSAVDVLIEKAIRAAMARFGGNLSMVAKSLEISRPTLYAKLKKYGIWKIATALRASQ